MEYNFTAAEAMEELKGRKRQAEEELEKKNQAITDAQNAKKALDPDGVEKERKSIADGLDLLRLVVADFQTEGLLEAHDDLDQVEAVGAQVVGERALGLDVGLFHAEILGNDADNLRLNFGCVHGVNLQK